MKKFFVTLLAFVLCMAFAATALAEPAAGDNFEIEEGYLSVTIPEGYYVLTQNMDESYEFFRDFEVDLEAMENYLVEQKIFLDLFSKDLDHEITVMVQTLEEANIGQEFAYEYDDIPKKYHDDMIKAMMEEPASIQGYTVEFLDMEFVEIGGHQWIRGKANMTDANGTVSDRLQYSTIKNGMVLNVNLFSTGESSAASFQNEIDALMENITLGTRVGYIPPEIPEGFSWNEAAKRSMHGAVIGAIAALVAGGVGIGIGKKKKGKKAAAQDTADHH